MKILQSKRAMTASVHELVQLLLIVSPLISGCDNQATPVVPVAKKVNPATSLNAAEQPQQPVTVVEKKPSSPSEDNSWDDTLLADLKPTVPNPKVDYRNSLGMNFVRIEAGSFSMGTTNEQLKRVGIKFGSDFADGEQPVHPVTITKPFFISIYETTCADYEAFVTATEYRTAFFVGAPGVPTDGL